VLCQHLPRVLRGILTETMPGSYSRTSHNPAIPRLLPSFICGHPGVSIIHPPRVPSSSPDYIAPPPPSLGEELLDDTVLTPAASPLEPSLSAPVPPLMTSLLHLPGRPLTLSDFPSPSPDNSMSSTPGSPYQRRFPLEWKRPHLISRFVRVLLSVFGPPHWLENAPVQNGTWLYLTPLPPRSLTDTNRLSLLEGRFRSSRHHSVLLTMALTRSSCSGNGDLHESNLAHSRLLSHGVCQHSHLPLSRLCSKKVLVLDRWTGLPVHSQSPGNRSTPLCSKAMHPVMYYILAGAYSGHRHVVPTAKPVIPP